MVVLEINLHRARVEIAHHFGGAHGIFLPREVVHPRPFVYIHSHQCLAS